MTGEEARDEIKNILDYVTGKKELESIKTREEAEVEERKGIEALEMAIKALEQEPKWFPVDYDRYPETYPKAFQEVWVTDGYGEVYHKAYDGTRSIKAWMPYIIPEPYKKESGGKE